MKTTLKNQWNGAPSHQTFDYSLRITDQTLTFDVTFASTAKGLPNSKSGQYTPELWKWDVAELFISNLEGKYLEINLSPTGAYWIQGFLTTRCPDPEFTPSLYNARASSEGIQLSLTALETYLGASSAWRLNVTGILNSPDYIFLSQTPLPGGEADFHQPQHFSFALI